MLQDTGLQGKQPQASFCFKNSPVTTPSIGKRLYKIRFLQELCPQRAGKPDQSKSYKRNSSPLVP